MGDPVGRWRRDGCGCWRRKEDDDMSAPAVNLGFCRVRQTTRLANSSSAVRHNYIHMVSGLSGCEIHISEHSKPSSSLPLDNSPENYLSRPWLSLYHFLSATCSATTGGILYASQARVFNNDFLLKPSDISWIDSRLCLLFFSSVLSCIVYFIM